MTDFQRLAECQIISRARLNKIKELENDKNTIEGFNFQLANKIKELEEKLKVARETLEWYGDEDNWYITTADKGMPVPHCPTSDDWGDKAREALEKINKKE